MTRFDIVGMNRGEPAMNEKQHEQLSKAVYDNEMDPIVKVKEKHLMVSGDESVTYGTIEVPSKKRRYCHNEEVVLVLKKEGVEPMKRVLHGLFS